MRHLRHSKNNQAGFTITELLFAMTIFSLILVAATATLIQITRIYYKSVITTRTQNAARSVLDDISRQIQFTGSDIGNTATQLNNETSQVQVSAVPMGVVAGTSLPYYQSCIGLTRFTYVLDAQLRSDVAFSSDAVTGNRVRHVLWQDMLPNDQTACNYNAPDLRQIAPSPGGRELVPENVRLTRFDITDISGANRTFAVALTMLYGDQDLIDRTDPTRPVCEGGGIVGSQFCGLAELTTVVTRRIR